MEAKLRRCFVHVDIKINTVKNATYPHVIIIMMTMVMMMMMNIKQHEPNEVELNFKLPIHLIQS